MSFELEVDGDSCNPYNFFLVNMEISLPLFHLISTRAPLKTCMAPALALHLWPTISSSSILEHSYHSLMTSIFHHTYWCLLSIYLWPWTLCYFLTKTLPSKALYVTTQSFVGRHNELSEEPIHFLSHGWKLSEIWHSVRLVLLLHLKSQPSFCQFYTLEKLC